MAVPDAFHSPLKGGRPLKRWRYVGVFGADLLLCAGRVRVAGVPQVFWGVWDRRAGVLRERTRVGPAALGRAVLLPDDALCVRDRGVRIDLALAPAGDVVEVTSRHGAAPIWTCKHPATAHGTVMVDGLTVTIDAPALVDDSAGWHARRTAWDWCAGAGRDPEGRRLQ